MAKDYLHEQRLQEKTVNLFSVAFRIYGKLEERFLTECKSERMSSAKG